MDADPHKPLREDVRLLGETLKEHAGELVQKYNRIAAALAARDRPDLTPPELEKLTEVLHREIATAWETSEVREERPTPLDEVRSGLIVFEQSLWDTLPRYLRTWTARSQPPIPMSTRSICCRWRSCAESGVTPDPRVSAALMLTVNGIAAECATRADTIPNIVRCLYVC